MPRPTHNAPTFHILPNGKRIPDGAWLRQEMRPCGSPRCRRVPDLHGPYWSAYYRAPGQEQLHHIYIGRELPDALRHLANPTE